MPFAGLEGDGIEHAMLPGVPAMPEEILYKLAKLTFCILCTPELFQGPESGPLFACRDIVWWISKFTYWFENNVMEICYKYLKVLMLKF